MLDLGCAHGSFPSDATPAKFVRIDREPADNRDTAAWFVQSDAARLPFADRTFTAVISNHSLEHFDDLNAALCEIGRVISPEGSLFVAVPDASTLTDRLYRWLARGGGHVNAFTSGTEIAATIERVTGLPHVATKLLCSSLSFLNRRNSPRPLPRRLWLLGGGYEWPLIVYSWISRTLDRHLNMRTSIYGWAFYFGRTAEPIDRQSWPNVCIRCGSGHSALTLLDQGFVRRTFMGLRTYRCPTCGAGNHFTE